MKYIILILFLFAFINPIIYLSAQTPNPTNTIGIDESNSIFAGCRVSKLQDSFAADNKFVETPEQDAAIKANSAKIKRQYIQGCIQEVIRFVIIIAALSAILSLAAAGVLALYKPNPKPIRKKLTNTIIGLFLLIAGWNLIGLLNASFNNLDFLSLPSLNYCGVSNGCTPEKVLKELRYRGCVSRYELIINEKKYGGNKADKEALSKCINDFCKETDTYKTVSKETCQDKNSIVALIDKAIADGIELRKSQSSNQGGQVADSQLVSELERLIKAGKIQHIDGQPDIIIKQAKEGKLKNNTIRMLVELAKTPEYDAIKIWEPYRPENPPKYHGKGLAIDFKSVTIKGKEYTADDAFAGRADEQYFKLADNIFSKKISYQIIMAGAIVDKLKAKENFSAGRGQGTVNKMRITTTPNGEDKTQRHEDHWHIDIFE
jgi:hypothetical protein